MEEKAELLFTPGCEAGSDKCDGCGRIRQENYLAAAFCPPYEEVLRKEGNVNYGDPLRCQPCLEAETKAKEMREKLRYIILELEGRENSLPRHPSGNFGDSYHRGRSDGLNEAIDLLEDIIGG